MAELVPVQPVQLVVGVLLANTELLAPVERALEDRFSPIDRRSQLYPFDVTGYYDDEMGDGLRRVLYAFRDLVEPEAIAEIKLATNAVEKYFAYSGRRRVNIDPGYMDFHKLVLASAKFLGQKIHIGKGIYADPTLYYDKGWKPYPWGFPDFRDGRYGEFLSQVRMAYKVKIRASSAEGSAPAPQEA
jgi:hypothetical protein